MKFTRLTFLLLSISVILFSCKQAVEEDTTEETTEEVVNTSNEVVLPSWEEAPKTRIVEWVASVTTEGSADFIPVKDRIAVFDNDGTLWPEQPVPNQLIYMLDYYKTHINDHPEWQKDPVIDGAINGDIEPLKNSGMDGLLKFINTSYADLTEEAYISSVKKWIDTAHNKKFNKLYKEAVYQPMLELLDYLQTHEFKTFIVSGGGADFMRVWTEEVYNIPPYQVVGSYGEIKYEVEDGNPVIRKMAGMPFIDDKTQKPEAIHRFIGKKPVFCGGNSDGDQAMMQYTSSSPYKSMCVILHHTDSIREFKYDTKTLSGHLETALEEAKEKNWLVIDMENDFKRIFSFD